jgi:hypothetical protein
MMMIKLDEFSPHEYVLGDKQVQILLSESHVHACRQEKMTPRRYAHLEPERSPEIHDTLQNSHIKNLYLISVRRVSA